MLDKYYMFNACSVQYLLAEINILLAAQRKSAEDTQHKTQKAFLKIQFIDRFGIYFENMKYC